MRHNRHVHLPLTLLLLACRAPDGPPGPITSRIPAGEHATIAAPFEPLPASIELDPLRVGLGKRLFGDVRLSGDGLRACVDCHALDQGGVAPGESRSNHPDRPTGPYNVPTVFNVAFNAYYNWDGEFDTLEEHLGGPMMSQAVMDAGSWSDLVARLRPAYDDAFRGAGYPGVDEESVRDAMAIYQRSLITPDAPFDRHLRGEAPLEGLALAGYRRFREVGCSSCHQGINIGGNLLQRFGVFDDPYDGRPLTDEDYGRVGLTGDPDDAFVFRVPSLRNVAETAPYFHDGSAKTLEEAVETMARVQLGFTLDEQEVAEIVAFLRTLTGRPPGGGP